MHPEPEVSRPRRRLVVGGLVAVPFLLTLGARPAYATGGSLGTYGGGYDMPTEPERPEPTTAPSGSTNPGSRTNPNLR